MAFGACRLLATYLALVEFGDAAGTLSGLGGIAGTVGSLSAGRMVSDIGMS